MALALGSAGLQPALVSWKDVAGVAAWAFRRGLAALVFGQAGAEPQAWTTAGRKGTEQEGRVVGPFHSLHRRICAVSLAGWGRRCLVPPGRAADLVGQWPVPGGTFLGGVWCHPVGPLTWWVSGLN